LIWRRPFWGWGGPPPIYRSLHSRAPPDWRDLGGRTGIAADSSLWFPLAVSRKTAPSRAGRIPRHTRSAFPARPPEFRLLVNSAAARRPPPTPHPVRAVPRLCFRQKFRQKSPPRLAEVAPWRPAPYRAAIPRATTREPLRLQAAPHCPRPQLLP